MSELESGIRRLGDARLKQALRSSTHSNIASVSIGVVTTAILQSSSMVSLLVLAFASAGLLPLVNAIGILLGANLGTTATGWIVATLGFKLDLEALAIPLIGGAAFLNVFSKEKSRLQSSSLLFIGLGLLLFGLSLMKTNMETLPEHWNVADITGHRPVVYLLFGVAITSLVQSSSAVMMMALAAVNSNLIGLSEAAALIIGADLGTTSTTILGSLRGSIIKRKLAFSHFAFNLIVDLAAFFLLLPFLPQLLFILGISDPLYGLVAFHSTMNLIGLLVFLPFIQVYADWIENLFSRFKLHVLTILERVPANITDAALVALHKNTIAMTLQTIRNALQLFSLHPESNSLLKQLAESNSTTLLGESFRQGYENLKNSEDAVSRYILEMQLQPLDETQASEVVAYTQIVRQLIYSNKTLKDIVDDMDDLKLSDEESLRAFYDQQRQYQQEISDKILQLLAGGHPASFIQEELDYLETRNNGHLEEMNQLVYKDMKRRHLESLSLSSQLNVNHEIHHATRYLIQAVRELLARQISTEALSA